MKNSTKWYNLPNKTVLFCIFFGCIECNITVGDVKFDYAGEYKNYSIDELREVYE